MAEEPAKFTGRPAADGGKFFRGHGDSAQELGLERTFLAI